MIDFYNSVTERYWVLAHIIGWIKVCQVHPYIVSNLYFKLIPHYEPGHNGQVTHFLWKRSSSATWSGGLGHILIFELNFLISNTSQYYNNNISWYAKSSIVLHSTNLTIGTERNQKYCFLMSIKHQHFIIISFFQIYFGLVPLSPDDMWYIGNRLLTKVFLRVSFRD
jgi:hypothetical protein